VGFSPEGLLVAAGDRFGGVFLWEAESGQEFWTLRGHTKAIRGLAWRQDADVLATASEDGTVRTWDLHTGQQQAVWDAHPGGVTAMTWHPSGRIVTGGRDRRIKVWDETGQLLADLGPTAEGVTRVGMTADGSAVVSGDWSGMVHLWPLTGGKPAPLPLPVLPAATVAMPVPQLRALPVRSVTQPALSKLDIATRELAAAKEALAAATRAVAEAERVLQELSAEQNRPRESVPGPSRSEP
jgi:WD40 repeat protein